MKTQRVRTKASIELIDLVRPGLQWLSGMSIELAFEVLRWMVRTGEPYRERVPWGYRGVRELLSGASGLSYTGVAPIRSIQDLGMRFHYALLSKEWDGACSRWREDLGVHVHGRVEIECRHFKPFGGVPHLGFNSEQEIRESVARLLGVRAGTKLTASLNCVHRKARTVHGVSVVVTPDGFVFRLSYGFNANGPGQRDSEWHHILASTQGKETFTETLARALAEFERIRTERFVVDLLAA